MQLRDTHLPVNPICMKKEDAEKTLLSLEDGREILAVLPVESKILERQGLIHGYHCSVGVAYEFPNGLLSFVTACRAFYSACGTYVTPSLTREFELSEKEWGIKSN